MSLKTEPVDAGALDTLVARAETLLIVTRPDVERLAWNLAAAIRQLRAENTGMRQDLVLVLGALLELTPEDLEEPPP